MRHSARIVAMFLALSLMGGAQACMAFCAQPLGHGADREVKTCPNCPPRGPNKTSAPASQFPCKLCQGAVQNRVADEGVSPVSFHLDLAWLPALPATQATPLYDPAFAPRSLLNHGPPGELLHQFCVLLI